MLTKANFLLGFIYCVDVTSGGLKDQELGLPSGVSFMVWVIQIMYNDINTTWSLPKQIPNVEMDYKTQWWDYP